MVDIKVKLSGHLAGVCAVCFAKGSKAPRPEGRDFPARWFHHIVPLDPVLKDGVKGHFPVDAFE
jgi:hypothetical protein